MARIVASNDDDDDDTYSMELTSVQEPTLGQLFKNFHGHESPVHESISNRGYDNDLTTVPFVLSFENLTYNVSLRHKLDFRNLFPSRKKRTEDDPEIARTGQEPKPNTKTLLNNISGETRDGEIMAVLGASGSGKSTLIDALANRISKESLKGDVKLNGEALQSRTLKVISAYVMQDDLLFPMLTVEETLMFAAEFRLPRNLPKHKKKLRVQALIDQLGIKNASSTIIGDEGHRGISGGERRRVSIGIDIIHDPIVLFLDEPTSGLDSTSAFMVVKVLKRIAASGSIVIMSIHQPSHRVLGLLDRLIMLSRGDTVFSGTPASLPRFFEEFGCPIPENENLTEFALDLIRELEGSDKGNGGLVEFNRNWQLNRRETPPPSTKLTLKEAIAASIRRGKLVSGVESTHNDGSTVTTSATAAISTLAVRETVWKSIAAIISRGKLFRGRESTHSEGSATVTTSAAAIETLAVPDFANPTWIEIKTLSKRSILNFRRQPEIFGVRIATVVITGLILATVFWRLDDSPRGVQERLGFFAFAMSTMFYTCTDALPVFLQERYIFMRETAYNAYRRSSYVVSHAVVTFPSLVFLSLAFSMTTFWAVGLSGGPMGFLFYNLIILASFWAGSSFVTFISGVVPHVMLGYTIVVAILAYFLLLSGFFINRNRIPDYWIWFHYMSLVKYPYEAVLQNEFSDATRCFVRGVQTFENTPLGVLPEPMKLKLLDTISESLGIVISSSTCLTNGEDILKHQGITQLGKWYCLLVTVGFGFLFRVLFYLTLLLGSKNKRR